jgi:Glycosyl hydrolases family 6
VGVPRRPIATCVAVVAAAIALVGVAPPSAHAGANDPTNPLVGRRQFIDCEAGHTASASSFSPWWRYYRAGRARRALLAKIAQVPQVKWFAGVGDPRTLGRRAERFLANVDHPQWAGSRCAKRLRYPSAVWRASPVSDARRGPYTGSYPVMAIRAMDYSRCEVDWHGGARNSTAPDGVYRRWIDAFVAQLGRTYDSPAPYRYFNSAPAPDTHWRPFPEREATVIVEPDQLGRLGRHSRCMSPAGRSRALALLRYAVDQLGALPNVAVYIDVGEDGWLTESEAITFLRRSGVARARGFALNSTHFDSTAREIRYGNRIARALGRHYVVNTAENAHGKLPKRRWGPTGPNATNCNPPNAGLGRQPTTHTGEKWVDAFLWISRPGISSNKGDRCGRGPTTNVWWQEQALRLARRASFDRAAWPPDPL